MKKLKRLVVNNFDSLFYITCGAIIIGFGIVMFKLSEYDC